MSPLRLRKRRDGSLCLTDALGRTGPVLDEGKQVRDDREFPSTHGFTYEWLLANSNVVTINGDELRLELANARATYRTTNRTDRGVDVELVGFETFDPPPIDEAKAEEIQAAISDIRDAIGTLAEGSVPRAGKVVVIEDEE